MEGVPRRFSFDDERGVGYFVGHDRIDFGLYDEPPPPYAFWKPPETYIPPGEAPPPYEASVGMPPYGNGGIFNPLANGANMFAYSVGIPVSPPVRLQPPESDQRTISSDNCTFNCSNGSSETSVTEQVDTPTDGPVPSISSVSMRSENGRDSNSGDGHSVTVIRSDACYEELTSYQRENSEAIEASDTENSESHLQIDVANSNTSCSADISLPTDCTCNILSNCSRSEGSHCCINKRHSYAASGNSHWHRRTSSPGTKDKSNKRLSLQVVSSNDFYPDGDSETSVSLSPTYEQHVLSPSSSDSSSGDLDFNSGANHCAFSQQNPNEAYASNMEVVHSVKSKRRPLDKTLEQLKKFSLTRKKKERQEKFKQEKLLLNSVSVTSGSALQGSFPYVSQNLLDVTQNSQRRNWKPDRVSRNADVAEAVNLYLGREIRPRHAVINHVQRTLERQNGSQVRPQSLPLGDETCQKCIDANCQGCSLALESQSSCDKTVPTAISMCGGAIASGNQFSSLPVKQTPPSPTSSLTDSIQQYIAKQHAILACANGCETISGLQRSSLCRSGSVCSETGERKHCAGCSSSSDSCSSSGTSPSEFASQCCSAAANTYTATCTSVYHPSASQQSASDFHHNLLTKEKSFQPLHREKVPYSYKLRSSRTASSSLMGADHSKSMQGGMVTLHPKSPKLSRIVHNLHDNSAKPLQKSRDSANSLPQTCEVRPVSSCYGRHSENFFCSECQSSSHL